MAFNKSAHIRTNRGCRMALTLFVWPSAKACTSDAPHTQHTQHTHTHTHAQTHLASASSSSRSSLHRSERLSHSGLPKNPWPGHRMPLPPTWRQTACPRSMRPRLSRKRHVWNVAIFALDSTLAAGWSEGDSTASRSAADCRTYSPCKLGFGGQMIQT